MQLELGKSYVTREGKTVTVVHFDGSPDTRYPWRTDDGEWYRLDGTHTFAEERDEDIVALVHTTSISLTSGSRYKTVDGEVVDIIQKLPGVLTYPFYASCGRVYTETGIYIRSHPDDNSKDIIEFVEQIKVETEDSKPKSEFVKADTNKNMLSLIEPQFIMSLGDVLTFGAKKYAINNWQLCEDPTRYKDALLRHMYAYLGGELIDPDSGLPHTAHIACNTMFLQWFDSNTPS